MNALASIILIWFFGSCHSKINEKESLQGNQTLTVNLPYSDLKELKFDVNGEPYVSCLREEYAYRFSDLEMHLEHSNLSKLYSQALGVPKSKLDSLAKEELVRFVSDLYLPKKEQVFSKEQMNRSKNFEIIQTISASGSESSVTLNKKIHYELEKTIKGWLITKKGPIDLRSSN